LKFHTTRVGLRPKIFLSSLCDVSVSGKSLIFEQLNNLKRFFRFFEVLLLLFIYVDQNLEGIGFTCVDGLFGNSVKCRMEQICMREFKVGTNCVKWLDWRFNLVVFNGESTEVKG